jgi:hypothetical protein
MLYRVGHYIFIYDIGLYLYFNSLSYVLAICQIDCVPLSEISSGIKGYPVGESSTIDESTSVFDGIVA